MPLPLRLAILITLVVLSAVLITAALNYAKFVQVTDDLDRNRYEFLAEDLRGALESSLDLGLPLDQIENAQEVVNRQRERYPELLSIEVFDDTGQVLYSSARARPDLMLALEGEGVVSLPLDGDQVAATQLENPFGAVVGGVAIRVSAVGATARDRAMLGSLGTAVVTAAAMGTAAVAVMAVLLLTGLRRRLQMQEAIVASLMEPGDAPTDSAALGPFERAASRTLKDLRDVEQLVEQSRRENAGV